MISHSQTQSGSTYIHVFVTKCQILIVNKSDANWLKNCSVHYCDISNSITWLLIIIYSVSANGARHDTESIKVLLQY